LTDIQTKDHIVIVVKEQYRNLVVDPRTKAVFSHLNIEEHLPRIYSFWCFVIDVEAETNIYRGSAFEPHKKLGLTADHFQTWLKYLHDAITSRFQGPVADKWIAKSNEFGVLFQYKLGLLDDDSFLIGNPHK
jgi:hemoglobin